MAKRLDDLAVFRRLLVPLSAAPLVWVSGVRDCKLGPASTAQAQGEHQTKGDHPMRKNCSECGTGFDTCDRSSKALTCSKACSRKRKRQAERDYKQRPERREAERERMRRPEYREYQQEYRQRPERREYQQDYRQRPEVKEAKRNRYHALGGDSYRRALPTLLERDGYVCGICEKALPNDPSQIDVDHIVPVAVAKQMGWAKDQINDPANLQATHAHCNRVKQDSWDGTLPGDEPLQISLFEV